MHFITSLLFSIAACGEDSAAPEPATEEMTDVEDIPVPSEDKEDDETEESQPADEPDPDQPAETLSYAFSDADSLLYVQVYKDPSALGANLSHNHVMRAANFSGQMRYNRDDISECELNFLVPVNDLRVDEAAMRSYVGYDDTINDGDRATIRPGRRLSGPGVRQSPVAGIPVPRSRAGGMAAGSAPAQIRRQQEKGGIRQPLAVPA